METNKNSYIFIYASILVVVFASILSGASILLSPMQEKNIEIEKKQNILASVNIESTPENAEKLYDRKITESYVINSEGEKIEGDAFTIDMKSELEKPLEERKLPLFYGKKEDGGKNVIVPLRGKGLWGPIWGYISFEGDYNTVSGAYFDHKGETPGLGAEISTAEFQKQFLGKKIFNDEGEFVSIKVTKKKSGDNKHEVDAVSGGTITSNGLQDMLYDCLSGYKKYFNEHKNM